MKLIVGLGNPGSEYEQTRHNVGFVAVDAIARRYSANSVVRSKFHGLLTETTMPTTDGDTKVLLLKPTTYMNRSGLSVAAAVQFYKMDTAKDVLIVVDDVAIPCGQIRLRGSGGAGGHNGLTDVEQRLGTQEYARLRIGIDQPGEIPQRDYVLGRFRPEQRESIEAALDRAVAAAACWVRSGLQEAMNQFNQRHEPPNGVDDANVQERGTYV